MQTKLSVFMLFLGSLTTLNGFSQTNRDENLSASRKIHSFSNPSYLAYLGGLGNIETLRYEICFAPSISFHLKKYPDWEFEFVPQFLLRSYNQYSHPVKTPSYMPKCTLYYRFQKANDDKGDLYSFLTFGHHSNGQDGSFYKSDSTTINIKDGSFSSNYFLGGVIISYPEKDVFNLVSNLKFSANYYIIYQPVLRSLYGKLRFFADMESTIHLSKERENIFNDTKSKSKLIGSLQLGWIAQDLINAKSFDMKRLIFSYTLTYQPSFINELALFTRFYYGQDYYNINFERTLTFFQFGLAIKNFYF
jgi:hypothetical protein